MLVERVGVSRDARAAASGTDETATSSATAAAAPAGWQKIVVRFVEGRILKGYTQDFHPSRPQLSLWPAINAPAPERVVVPLARLKNEQAPRLMVYAHGGLNSETESIGRIRMLAPYFAANGVYPLFLTWKTGPIETLLQMLEDFLRPKLDTERAFATGAVRDQLA